MRPCVTPRMSGRRDKNNRHAHRRTVHGRGASNGNLHLGIAQNVTNRNGLNMTASVNSGRSGLDEESTNRGSGNRPRLRGADPSQPATAWFAGGQGCCLKSSV